MAVSNVPMILQGQIPEALTLRESWYGLQTRPRHEKMVAQRLAEKGVTTFLPLLTEEPPGAVVVIDEVKLDEPHVRQYIVAQLAWKIVSAAPIKARPEFALRLLPG